MGTQTTDFSSDMTFGTLQHCGSKYNDKFPATAILMEILPKKRNATQTTAEARCSNRRQPQARITVTASGIARDTWALVANVDAVSLLKQNILVFDKCPSIIGIFGDKQLQKSTKQNKAIMK